MNIFKISQWAKLFSKSDEVLNLEIEHDEYLLLLKKEKENYFKNIFPSVKKEIFVFVKKNKKFAEYVNRKNKEEKEKEFEIKLKKAKTEEDVLKLRPLAEELDNDITQEMINRANEYPIGKIVDVNDNNFAKCVNHDDRNPSMYCKNNYAYCFSCGWSGSVISVYMKKNNCNFKEAVKKMV